MDRPRRVPLIVSPTPMHQLGRAGDDLGIDLWIKRDDLTGFALGGNKGRKLEYLIAAALDSGADCVVTCGAIQSNFVRQLGAACACYGLECHAVVMRLPYDQAAGKPSGGTELANSGNELLDQLLGVHLQVVPDDDWEVLYKAMELHATELQQAGHRPYVIPVGGSSPLGALAFYEAAKEIDQEFDWIVTASSSGSTQTGLTYAFAGTRTRVLGVCSDPEPEIVHDFVDLGSSLAPLIGRDRLEASSFAMDFDHVGPGYGVPSEEGNAAISYLARREGIFLDPVYSGKAFAALMDLTSSGVLAGRVLFWHTGGIPALFAM